MTNEYAELRLILLELEGVISRENKRHEMDAHLVYSTREVVEQIISDLTDELDAW